MTEKRVRPASPTGTPPAKGVETQAAAVPYQKGQSASNLIGALARKPPAQTGGGGGEGSSTGAGAGGSSNNG
jgi:hypothetical protein